MGFRAFNFLLYLNLLTALYVWRLCMCVCVCAFVCICVYVLRDVAVGFLFIHNIIFVKYTQLHVVYLTLFHSFILHCT